jgi:predicted transcriptional regulator
VPFCLLAKPPWMMYIYTMDRTQIYLSETQAAALDRVASRTGRSRSQLIREAIDRTFLGESSTDALAILDSTAGAWKGRRENGAAYVRRLRRGRPARLFP